MGSNGDRLHYVIVSEIQWKPFWLATQVYPQNDWTGWQNGVNYDVCALASIIAVRLFSLSEFVTLSP